jgi:hypothetical protein
VSGGSSSSTVGARLRIPGSGRPYRRSRRRPVTRSGRGPGQASEPRGESRPSRPCSWPLEWARPSARPAAVSLRRSSAPRALLSRVRPSPWRPCASGRGNRSRAGAEVRGTVRLTGRGLPSAARATRGSGKTRLRRPRRRYRLRRPSPLPNRCPLPRLRRLPTAGPPRSPNPTRSLGQDPSPPCRPPSVGCPPPTARETGEADVSWL